MSAKIVHQGLRFLSETFIFDIIGGNISPIHVTRFRYNVLMKSRLSLKVLKKKVI